MSDLNQNFVKPVPSLEQIQDALSGAKSLDDFFGKNGVVAKLVGPTLEHMMQAELTGHLGYKKHEVIGRGSGNSRNGTYERKVKTSAGEIPIEVPRDREGNFEPVTLRRYATASNELEDRIIGMYAHGMSTRDIQDHLEETFGMDVSPTTISRGSVQYDHGKDLAAGGSLANQKFGSSLSIRILRCHSHQSKTRWKDPEYSCIYLPWYFHHWA